MRSTIQPQRRNSALYRKFEDLILWLKFENNLDDSSYYDQQVTGFNPDVFTVAEKEIDKATFDNTNYIVSPIDKKYTTYFEGGVIDKYSATFNTGQNEPKQAILVSGSGVFTADPDDDSAAYMNIDADSDFTFEFWAKHKHLPKGQDDDPGATYFDFGSLKFTNTSGFFTIHTPGGDQWDYFNRDFLLGIGNGLGRQGNYSYYRSVPTHTNHLDAAGNSCYWPERHFISTPLTFNMAHQLFSHTVAVDKGAISIDVNKAIWLNTDFQGLSQGLSTPTAIQIQIKKNGSVIHTINDDPGNLTMDDKCDVLDCGGIHYIEVEKGDVITAESAQGHWWSFFFDVLEIDNESGPNLTNTFTHYAIQRRNNTIELWMGHKNLDGTDGPFKLVEAHQDPAPVDPQGMNDFRVTGLSVVEKNNNQAEFKGWTEPYKNSRAIGSTISGTNFFTGWMDEFKVWGEAIYGPGVILPGGPWARGVYYGGNKESMKSDVAGQVACVTSPCPTAPLQPTPDPGRGYYTQFVYESSTVFLYCKVASIYDPRYSLHQPLPYTVKWYAKGRYVGESRSSEYESMTQIPGTKYAVGLYGHNELAIANFMKQDEGIYYAKVYMGDPDRPKYSYTTLSDGITPVYLRTRYPIITCFSKGTKVSLPNKIEKNIEDIEAGDKILSYNTEKKVIEEDEVLSVAQDETEEVNILTFDNGTKNKNTAAHPYFTKEKKWASLSPNETSKMHGMDIEELKIGDTCYVHDKNKNLEETKLISVQKEKGLTEVYNIARVKQNNNYFANKFLVHNKSPAPVLWWNIVCLGRKVSPGEDVTLSATTWDGRWWRHRPPWSLLPPGPTAVTWTNKGRGIQKDMNDAWSTSTLSFKNVRKSIKGPICAHMTDANGQYWGGPCCAGITVDLPQILCPIIDSTSPDKTTNKFVVQPCPYVRSTTLCEGRPVYNWSNSQCTMYSHLVISNEIPSLTQTYKVNARDPNITELETGGLEYKWSIHGIQEEAGVGSLRSEVDANWNNNTSKSYTFLENFSGYIACEVKYKNYPSYLDNPNWAYDPEGGYQYARSTKMYWYINFPECVEPTLFYYRPTVTSTGGHNWTLPRYGGYRGVANLINLGQGKEHGSTTYTIKCPSCSNIIIPYSVLGNLGVWNRTKAVYPYWLSNRGFTKTVTHLGNTQGMIMAVPSTTYPGAFGGGYYYTYSKGEHTYLYKDLYLNDNNTSLTVRASNDCGITDLVYNFQVYKLPKPHLYTRSSSWNWGWWFNQGTSTINYYYQELDWYNWRTNQVETYYREWPAHDQQHILVIRNVYEGCAGIRISINGKIVQNWIEAPFGSKTYNNGALLFNTKGSFALNYWRWGWSKQAWLTFSKDKSKWDKKSNTVKIEVVNNLPAKGQFAQGDISSLTYTVNFNTVPKITTPTTYPRWGWWWCGYYYWGWWGYYRRAWWWWRPWCWWYNPLYGGWTKKQTSFVAPSANRVSSVRSLRGTRLSP